MGKTGILTIFNTVKKAVEVKKASNEQQFHQEYVNYSPENNRGIPYETNGYSSMEAVWDKILRIPFSYFMTVESCTLKEDGYQLCTYVPGKLPVLQKCGLFQSRQEDIRLHRHDYFEMIYVYKGKRTTQVEDQEIVLEEKEVCIFDMQCAHLDIRMKSEGTAFYCCFTNKLIDSYFLEHLNHRRVREFLGKKDADRPGASYLRLKADAKMVERIEQDFDAVFRELEKAEPGYDRIAQTHTMRILNHLDSDTQPDVVVFSKRLRGTKLFQAVARYISSNIAEISLESLCDQFHYQADYYNRLIKKNTGLTYSEYVHQFRMEKAKNLLVNTDMTVREIMQYLGYQSHAYFYKSFQKETGMTPIEYRNHKKS